MSRPSATPAAPRVTVTRASVVGSTVLPADHHVVAGVAVRRVVAAAALDDVVALATAHEVVAAGAEDPVAVVAAVQLVVEHRAARRGGRRPRLRATGEQRDPAGRLGLRAAEHGAVRRSGPSPHRVRTAAGTAGAVLQPAAATWVTTDCGDDEPFSATRTSAPRPPSSTSSPSVVPEVVAAADEGVVALVAAQPVVAVAAEQVVVTDAADQHVVVRAAEQHVRAGVAEHQVVAVAAVGEVRAVAATEVVRARATGETVVAVTDRGRSPRRRWPAWCPSIEASGTVPVSASVDVAVPVEVDPTVDDDGRRRRPGR